MNVSIRTQQFRHSIALAPSPAPEALFAAAYPELCRLARARLRDGGRNTLIDTTALVHES